MTSWEPVVDYLMENMQKQTYKKDERLPSEHELAQRFELTRIEVRKAYDRLKEMGYVYSRQGKGNYYAGYLEKVELVPVSYTHLRCAVMPRLMKISESETPRSLLW